MVFFNIILVVILIIITILQSIQTYKKLKEENTL